MVVLVHGSLDRAASFTRTIRRLEDLGVVTYDRRGYQGSRGTGPGPALDEHVADLLALVAALPGPHRPITAVGHSVGGDVVIAAAIADPAPFASIGAFEPPMPWLGFRRARPASDATGDAAPWPPLATDPGQEAERFFHRMVGESVWERLPEEARAMRRADGPALVADLVGIRGSAPFDPTALTVPALFGRGGAASEPHHRETVAWLASHVPGARLFEIEGSGHGAHLTHPDGFAAFVRQAVLMGGETTTSSGAATVSLEGSAG